MDTILHFLLGTPCIFRQMTGLYCPGCGGTRAAIALLSGHPVRSFLLHPIILYGAAAGAALLFFWLRRLAGGRSYRGSLRGRKRRKNPAGQPEGSQPERFPAVPWLWGGLILVLGNWLLRNFLLLAFGIPIG